MISLIESILSSTNSGKNQYIKTLIKDPFGKEDELTNMWKSLSLGFDEGDGEGYWYENSKHTTLAYQIPRIVNNKIEERTGAIIGHDLASAIVIVNPEKGRRAVKKWAEKIARILNMNVFQDKNFIYLNFVE